MQRKSCPEPSIYMVNRKTSHISFRALNYTARTPTHVSLDKWRAMRCLPSHETVSVKQSRDMPAKIMSLCCVTRIGFDFRLSL